MRCEESREQSIIRYSGRWHIALAFETCLSVPPGSEAASRAAEQLPHVGLAAAASRLGQRKGPAAEGLQGQSRDGPGGAGGGRRHLQQIEGAEACCYNKWNRS